MRVLQIIDNIKLDSGVSSAVMNIYKNINKEACQFSFLICKNDITDENQYYSEITKNGDEIFFSNNILSVSSFKDALSDIKKFFKEHAKDYDIVHLHSPTISLFTLRYAKKYGVKCRIIHSHSSMTSPNKLKALINRFLMSGKKYANVCWACSDMAAEFLYGTKENIEIIRNAVDCKKIFFDESIRNTARNELNLKDKKVIAHISNFSPIKNHVFLINVIEEVIKEDKNYMFLFVGDGPSKEEFEAEIVRNNLQNNVIFTGRQKDVKKYLCAADLLVLPSIKEGLPVVVVEAQACGLPCFVSDAVTKQCNAGNVRFLPLSEETWIKAIKEVSIKTPETRKKTSDEFKFNKFSAEIEAKRVEKLYKELMEDK